MTPDDVRALVGGHYPRLVAERRSNPDGWSFFAGPPIRGADSNRIFRVVANSAGGPARLKLAVTSRLTSEFDIPFRGDETELMALIDREIALFEQHFEE